MFCDFVNRVNTSTNQISFFINKLPKDDLIGLETGIAKAQCSCVLLQTCPTIKTLDLVDAFVPYDDYIGSEILKFETRKYRKFNGSYVYEEDILDLFSGLSSEEVHEILMEINHDDITPDLSLDEDESNNTLNIAKLNLFSSGFVEKVNLYAMDTNDFLKKVPDEHYDFIFLDAHLTYKQIYEDLEKWLPKLKTGGLFAGHDYYCPSVWWAVNNFRKFNSIDDKMYKVHNDAFVWYKGIKDGIMGIGK